MQMSNSKEVETKGIPKVPSTFYSLCALTCQHAVTGNHCAPSSTSWGTERAVCARLTITLLTAVPPPTTPSCSGTQLKCHLLCKGTPHCSPPSTSSGAHYFPSRVQSDASLTQGSRRYVLPSSLPQWVDWAWKCSKMYVQSQCQDLTS